METRSDNQLFCSDAESAAVMMIASLMAASARTAPKGKGIDTIVTKILSGDDLYSLADKMQNIGETTGTHIFLRDSQNVRDCQAIVLVGCQGFIECGLNCGGCGYSTCQEMKEKYKSNRLQKTFYGPNCVIRMTDLGIAIGSAVKTAQIHNADNRIFYTAGVAALSLGLLSDCTCAYGIPLSLSGKNIFFDRRV